jgi:hypothetical protein
VLILEGFFCELRLRKRGTGAHAVRAARAPDAVQGEGCCTFFVARRAPAAARGSNVV